MRDKCALPICNKIFTSSSRIFSCLIIRVRFLFYFVFVGVCLFQIPREIISNINLYLKRNFGYPGTPTRMADLDL